MSAGLQPKALNQPTSGNAGSNQHSGDQITAQPEFPGTVSCPVFHLLPETFDAQAHPNNGMGRPEGIADQPVETGSGDHQDNGLNGPELRRPSTS